ncbi:hypothetical protein HUA74_06250 [Myxococcus sp. CA051A]|nr:MULTISPECIES: hypothetical protein [unclassified Myxococcus]NTX54654.1 hypothetical protein [Myxococcus sp. CA039A]NTX60255.1 hypothetical protein [Myxococcus sp. CA051A]
MGLMCGAAERVGGRGLQDRLVEEARGRLIQPSTPTISLHTGCTSNPARSPEQLVDQIIHPTKQWRLSRRDEIRITNRIHHPSLWSCQYDLRKPDDTMRTSKEAPILISIDLRGTDMLGENPPQTSNLLPGQLGIPPPYDLHVIHALIHNASIVIDMNIINGTQPITSRTPHSDDQALVFRRPLRDG